MDPQPDFKRQNYWRKQDRKRREALQSEQWVTYATICDELGMDPEHQQGYELGKAELLQEKKQMKPSNLEGTINNTAGTWRETDDQERMTPNEREFLRKTQHYTNDINEGIELKQQALLKYSRERFGPEGSQPLPKYTGPQKGAMFNNVRESLLKKYHLKK